MSTVSTPKMTAEEFFDWANQPENGDRRFELEDGEAVETPPPSEIHGLVCSLVVRLLWAYLIQRGAGYVLSNDTGLVVRRGPDTVRGPDVMAFLESRSLDQMSRKFCVRVPTLVVEVLSPTDTMKKTLVRVGQYLKMGVPLVWVIDPDEPVVYVYRPDEFAKILDDADVLTGNGVLPDFRCRVADLFTLPGQSPPPPAAPQTPSSPEA